MHFFANHNSFPPPFLLLILLVVFIACSNEDTPYPSNYEEGVWKIVDTDSIDLCVSDLCVGFSLLPINNEIYVSYYDKDHYLKVAKRDQYRNWTYVTLNNEKVDYDSHRYTTLSMDEEGYLHLAANMHASSLVYYKSVFKGDISSLSKNQMLGINETQCTYPVFIKSDNGLIFHYRDGYPGNGKEIFNLYDIKKKHWVRLMDSPLFDGKGQSNAYMLGPELLEDGNFHMVWCWRDNPDCATNHGLYYAISPDLKRWYNINGYECIIPLSPNNDEFLVDDIPINGGLLNIGFNFGYNKEHGPIIAYHKYDSLGYTNLFVSYQKNNSWIVEQLTDWTWRWNFSGNGSISNELIIDEVTRVDDRLKVVYNKQYGGNKVIWYSVNDRSKTEYEYSQLPIELNKADDSCKVVNVIYNRPTYTQKSLYVLRYETIDVNRDSPTDIIPTNSVLKLYYLMR